MTQSIRTAQPQFIAYYRVSTERQGRSGLGLDAQREAVGEYVRRSGGALLGGFTEVESGKLSQRPELRLALAECRKRRAVLIIAKLDRLARSVHFISGLMESGAEFVAVDNPHANKLMLHLLAAFAEHEREMISERTKAALAAAKARGVQLGANGKVLAERNRNAADAFAAEIAAEILSHQARGLSYAAIARVLNQTGAVTCKGGRWHPQTVQRILKRVTLGQAGGMNR